MKSGILALFGLISTVYLGVAANDPQCTNYDHTTYGYNGQCISTSQCPGNVYIPNLCPTYPNDVKCCFSANDPECTSYNHPLYGYSGQCISTSQCSGNVYIPNLCPTHPYDVKCCFSANDDDDDDCIGHNHPTYGYSGQCIATSECPGNEYISGLCPSYPNGVKCCFTTGEPECTTYYDSTYGLTGTCMYVSSCPGSTITNLCPTEDDDIKCCFTDPGTAFDPCHDVTMVSRAEWGARHPVSTTLLTMPVDYVFIHHTDGSPCLTSSDCEARVRGIQNYHMDTRGYDDIAYSFLVGGDGRIYEGRGWGVNGAHTKGYNDVGFAFSFIGDYTSELPSVASLKAAANAIACGVQEGKIKTGYTLRGHKDMPNASTACPGTRLHELIQKWPHY